MILSLRLRVVVLHRGRRQTWEWHRQRYLNGWSLVASKTV